MADLMSGTYTYDSLFKKYDEFRVPSMKVFINGKELTDNKKIAITELKVLLSIDAASSVVFKIGGCYNIETHSFESNVKSMLKLGMVAEVQLGYLSKYESVFKGYVAIVGTEFIEEPQLVITLMDVRRLMMTGGRKQVLHNVTNYSDAVKTVMDSYSKLCSVKIDATSDKLTNPVSQTMNDYDFITRELIENARINREFFVLGDKAYFRKPRSVTAPIMTLTYGKELLTLQTSEEYTDLSVEVIGYDAKKQEVITSTKKVTSPSNQTKAISMTPTLTITDPDADTQNKADTRAEVIADKYEQKSKRAIASTLGLPEIVPGRFIKVKGLETMVDKTYYITEVVHEIDDKEFNTVFTMCGWTN